MAHLQRLDTDAFAVPSIVAFVKLVPSGKLSSHCVPQQLHELGALGVRHNSLWGHRGLSHSLCFAFVLSLCVVVLRCRDHAIFSWRWWTHALYFFVVTASHGVLDAMTDGGLGIAFFAPFDTTRYFLPWRPVRVSPISIKAFFSAWGLQVLGTELVFIWLPTTLLCAAARACRRG